MDKFWFVYRLTGSRRWGNRKHKSFESAETEARRLAALYPGVLFVVLETVGAAFVSPTKKPVDAKQKVS